MIAESGLILSTSRNLGGSPIVEFFTRSGSNGRAWVVGRNDDIGLALFEVIDPAQSFDFVEVAPRPVPQVGEELALLQYPSAGTTLDRRAARVVGVRQDFNTGIFYAQLQDLSVAGAEGGALVDAAGALRGIRMGEQQMVDLGLGRLGEVYAMDVGALSTLVLPQLQTGVSIIKFSSLGGSSPGAPPPIPAIFVGDIAIAGVPAEAGVRLYARAFKSSQPDIWFSTEIADTGRYVLTMSIFVSGYSNANIEFWLDAKQAPQTSLYTPGARTATDLAFP